MSIHEFMKDAHARGLSADDAIFEAQRKFVTSVLKRAGGSRGLRAAFESAAASAEISQRDSLPTNPYS